MFQIRYKSPNDYEVFNLLNDEKVNSITVDKMFDQDIFDIDKDEAKVIVFSKYREAKSLCGILVLQKNLLFGRTKRKYIYQCIPFDKFLPSFLLPFQKPVSFSKHFSNRFVRFRFSHWEDRHPTGILLETIGHTDSLSAYIQYQLYANNLWFKIPARKDFIKEIESSTAQNFFTIDPKGCKDFDDGFSVHNNVISIFISNVPQVLVQNQFWDWEQACTIYSPHGSRHMLPKTLSESICSLAADGTTKPCIRLDIDLMSDIKTFHLCMGKCVKNYVYDDESLNHNEQYKILEKYAKQKKTDVLNSHDVVEFFMMLFNKQGASIINDGIYRTTIQNETNVDFFKFRGEYTCEKKPHVILQNEYYGHFTSPIRRVVDIVNLFCLQKSLHLCDYTVQMDRFVQFWKNNIEEINRQCRISKFLQSQWFCLDLLSDKEFIEVEVTVLDRYNEVSYLVLLKDANHVMKLDTLEKLHIHDKVNCGLYLIENEITFYKKVRLKLL